MSYYAAFIDLSKLACLVVGAGEVGQRKITSLLECGPAKLLVLDPAPPDQTRSELWQSPPLQYIQRKFTPTDLLGINLVFAATSSPEINHQVAECCQRQGILCNSATSPEDGNFIVPSRVRRGRLELALSTNGASPALTKILRQELEAWLDPGYTKLVHLLDKIREPVIAAGFDSADNAVIFRALCSEPFRGCLIQHLTEKDTANSVKLLKTVLPAALYPNLEPLIAKIIDELG